MKGTSAEEDKQPVRRSQQKSLLVPAPVATSQQVATCQSRKLDDNVVEDTAALTPSKVKTAKKSNCARKPMPKEELEMVLSPALGSLQQPVSTTDLLSTTFSFKEVSFATVAASVAEFSVGEIVIVKSELSEAVHKDIPTLEAEEPTANDTYLKTQISADSQALVYQDATASQENKVVAEDENSFDDLVLVATEDNSIAQQIFASLIVYALLQSNTAKYLDEGSSQTQKSISALFDNDGPISGYIQHAMKNVQEAGHSVQTLSKELQAMMAGSSTSLGRDLAMAVKGGVYSISFYKSPKSTLAASVLAMGAVVYVTI